MRLDLGEGRMERDAGRSETDFGGNGSLRKSDAHAKSLWNKKKKGPVSDLISGLRCASGGVEGIRTLETLPSAPLAGVCLRPLGHHSADPFKG